MDVNPNRQVDSKLLTMSMATAGLKNFKPRIASWGLGLTRCPMVGCLPQNDGVCGWHLCECFCHLKFLSLQAGSSTSLVFERGGGDNANSMGVQAEEQLVDYIADQLG